MSYDRPQSVYRDPTPLEESYGAVYVNRTSGLMLGANFYPIQGEVERCIRIGEIPPLEPKEKPKGMMLKVVKR